MSMGTEKAGKIGLGINKRIRVQKNKIEQNRLWQKTRYLRRLMTRKKYLKSNRRKLSKKMQMEPPYAQWKVSV